MLCCGIPASFIKPRNLAALITWESSGLLLRSKFARVLVISEQLIIELTAITEKNLSIAIA